MISGKLAFSHYTETGKCIFFFEVRSMDEKAVSIAIFFLENSPGLTSLFCLTTDHKTVLDRVTTKDFLYLV